MKQLSYDKVGATADLDSLVANLFFRSLLPLNSVLYSVWKRRDVLGVSHPRVFSQVMVS